MHKKIFVLVLALLLISVGIVSAQSGNLPGSGWWSGQQIQNVGSASTSVLFTAYDARAMTSPAAIRRPRPPANRSTS